MQRFTNFTKPYNHTQACIWFRSHLLIPWRSLRRESTWTHACGNARSCLDTMAFSSYRYLDQDTYVPVPPAYVQQGWVYNCATLSWSIRVPNDTLFQPLQEARQLVLRIARACNHDPSFVISMSKTERHDASATLQLAPHYVCARAVCIAFDIVGHRFGIPPDFVNDETLSRCLKAASNKRKKLLDLVQDLVRVVDRLGEHPDFSDVYLRSKFTSTAKLFYRYLDAKFHLVGHALGKRIGKKELRVLVLEFVA